MTDWQALGIETSQVGNPHEVPAEMDRVFGARHDIAGYSETCFLTSWNPTERVGLFLHAGRCPQDIEMWWAQAIVYLPDGRLAVDRSWGRSPGDDTVQTGNFTIRMDNPLRGWSSSFDGAAELCTEGVLARRPGGSGPARPLKWEFVTEAAGPVWDMYAAIGHTNRQDFAKGSHTQQVLRIRGTVTVDGVEYPLDGVAGNDHSSGVRDMRNFGSHHFLIGSLPGRSVHMFSLFGMDGAELIVTGTEFSAGGRSRAVTLADVPPLTRLGDSALDFEATLVDSEGGKTPLRLEILHSVPISLNTDNDNINGVDRDGPEVLVLSESRVRMTLPDGTVGYGHLERSTQLSWLAGA
ncbi:MAG TPA: hypothetical protein VGH89_19785 [Pseudonocardia sp.]